MSRLDHVVSFLHETREAYRYFNSIASAKYSGALDIISSAPTLEEGLARLRDQSYYLPVVTAINQFLTEGEEYAQRLLAEIRYRQFVDIMGSLPGITPAQAEEYAAAGTPLADLWPLMTLEQKLGYYYYLQTITPLTPDEFAAAQTIITSILEEEAITGTLLPLDHQEVAPTGYHLILVSSTRDFTEILDLFARRHLIVATYQLTLSSWSGLLLVDPHHNVRRSIIKMVDRDRYPSYVVYHNTQRGIAGKYIALARRKGLILKEDTPLSFNTPEELMDYLAAPGDD